MKQLTVAASILLGLILTLPICHAAQLQQLSYDANGNLVSGDGFYREYDGYNRLVRTREGNAAGGTILEEQDWDLIEERVLARRTYTSGTLNKTVYYWTKDFVQVINASDGAITNETYVYFNDRLVAQRVNNDTTFIHSDHLGSSNVITSATGQLIERTIYEPYGKPITGATQSRLDYTGKEQLPTAGDYDYNFRRYNPNWGIFTQPDDRLPNVYDPQQLNRYAYAIANPSTNLDQDGHAAQAFVIILLVVELFTEVTYVIYTIVFSKKAVEEEDDSDSDKKQAQRHETVMSTPDPESTDKKVPTNQKSQTSTTKSANTATFEKSKLNGGFAVIPGPKDKKANSNLPSASKTTTGSKKAKLPAQKDVFNIGPQNYGTRQKQSAILGLKR